MSFVMTGRSLAAKCVDIAQRFKTIYMYACYGFQVTDKTITGKSQQNLNGWYTTSNIKKLRAVANENPPTWGFDCVNLIKGILWGWTGDETKEKGGAVYGANGVPDTNADGMIARCRNVTDDFSSIAIGEAVWMSGHIGVYIGDGMAVECTPRWADGVQITAVLNIGKISGMNGRRWTKHGKFPWVDYDDVTETEDTPEYALGSRLLKKGCTGEDVRELQRLLVQLGYNLGTFGPEGNGVDGEFGKATQQAVEGLQAAAGIEVDGKFGAASLTALKAALEAKDKAGEEAPAEPTYTVTIRGITQADMEVLLSKWPDAEVAGE